MLITYRRHRKACPHRDKGRSYRHCLCPVWVDGFLDGEEIRKSLRLRDWQKAQSVVRQWETEGRSEQKSEQSQPATIEEGWNAFLAASKARNLHPETLRKYQQLSSQMLEFSRARGLRFLREFDLPILDEFRARWKDGPRSALKKLERMRAFYRFAQKRKCVDENLASELKPPRVQAHPTLPFTQQEMMRILEATDNYPGAFGRWDGANVNRIRAFVLLLRYAGLRIGDAVSCPRERLTENKLLLYTQKTGVPVHIVLPEFVMQALAAVPRANEKYFFWSGAGKLRSAIGSWQRTLRAVFRLAKIAGGHAHRFRDTFAVELLQDGVPIEHVSVLLGHSSIQVTQRHYNPWVLARQKQLEADLERAWNHDPILLLHARGTREVHEQKGAGN